MQDMPVSRSLCDQVPSPNIIFYFPCISPFHSPCLFYNQDGRLFDLMISGYHNSS